MTDRSTAKPLAMMQPLCQAVREGRKTVTRRLINFIEPLDDASWHIVGCAFGVDTENVAATAIDLVPTKSGELRYLTETHWAFGHWDHVQKKGRMGWQFACDRRDDIRFEAPNCALASMDKADPGIPTWYKRNARFMPRAYARTFIRVKDVRVERVQDITEADAIAEGVERVDYAGDIPEYFGTFGWKSYETYSDGSRHPHAFCPNKSPITSYAELWDSLHRDIYHQWAANPWVARIEFERIEI